jgi:hypothetical protein
MHKLLDNIVITLHGCLEKAKYLRLCLKVKSPVDKWYQELDMAVKADWDQLEQAFAQKWTTHQPKQKLNLDKTEDLLNHRLKLEEVGEMVLYWGKDEYTHIIWAKEVQEMVQELGFYASFQYVHQVQNNLPDPVRDNLEGQVTDWATFIVVVKAINMEKLQTRAKAEKKQEDKDRVREKEMDELRAQVLKPAVILYNPKRVRVKHGN